MSVTCSCVAYDGAREGADAVVDILACPFTEYCPWQGMLLVSKRRRSRLSSRSDALLDDIGDDDDTGLEHVCVGLAPALQCLALPGVAARVSSFCSSAAVHVYCHCLRGLCTETAAMLRLPPDAAAAHVWCADVVVPVPAATSAKALSLVCTSDGHGRSPWLSLLKLTGALPVLLDAATCFLDADVAVRLGAGGVCVWALLASNTRRDLVCLQARSGSWHVLCTLSPSTLKPRSQPPSSLAALDFKRSTTTGRVHVRRVPDLSVVQAALMPLRCCLSAVRAA